MRLAGKVALVTGAAAGIGEAIARRFAAEGATVYLGDVADAAGTAVAAEIGSAFLHLDVAAEDSWHAATAQIGAERGRLDILVNNAGIVSNLPIDMMTLDAWSRVLAVDLTGPMIGSRDAIAMMRCNPQPGGAIINIASSVAFLGLPNDAVYTAAKAGLLGLTRSAAARCAEQGWNIRVNSLHPGTTDTAILRGHIAHDPSLLDKFNAMSPMGRMAKPEEVAALAVFLASDEASYCTGGAYTVDGGLTSTHPVM